MNYMFHLICDGEMQGSYGNTRGLNYTRKITEVNYEQLKQQFDGFLKAIDSLFDNSAFAQNSSFVVDEVELNLSIGTEGQISILSSIAGGFSASSGVRIKLKRKQ